MLNVITTLIWCHLNSLFLEVPNIAKNITLPRFLIYSIQYLEFRYDSLKVYGIEKYAFSQHWLGVREHTRCGSLL